VPEPLLSGGEPRHERPAFREARSRLAGPTIVAMDRYEIRVAGHLDQRRARFLGCEELRLLPDGDTLLVVAAVDQAALYGLLTRLRDAGLELIAAERISVSKEDSDVAD
jgi:hypothetical protein